MHGVSPFPRSHLLTAALIATLSLGLTACAADDGQASATGGMREVLLGLNEGVVFSTGEITKGASIKASDLLVFAHKGEDIDLKPGVDPQGTAHRQAKVFRDGDQPTSPNLVFDNLDQVPATIPDGSVQDDYLRRAARGNALVVENNVSGGYTKVFVDLYNKPGRNVRLHYVAVAGK